MRAYVVADVFTDVPLQGNPVAVFTDAAGLSAELMQRAARELNLSETVFVVSPAATPSATPTSGSSPQPWSCPSPATRCWGRHSCSASASAWTPCA